MNRQELWQRIAARPNAVRFAELEKLLLAFGWRFERAGEGTIWSTPEARNGSPSPTGAT